MPAREETLHGRELRVWRCRACGRILTELDPTPPTRLRAICKCNAVNLLLAAPCPLCEGRCDGVVYLTNGGRVDPGKPC